MLVKRAIAIGLVWGASTLFGFAEPLSAKELWTERVEPLLERHCFKCHGGVYQKSDLDLRSLENILKGGENGPAIVPGKPEESRLYQYIQPGADPHMPPKAKLQLNPKEMGFIETWIRSLPRVETILDIDHLPQNVGRASSLPVPGASLPRVSSSSLPPAPAEKIAARQPQEDTPPTTDSSWPSRYVTRLEKLRRPVWVPPPDMPPCEVVDRFIRLGWKQRRLEASPRCDDSRFVRRVFLDLAGRIPTPSEAKAFLQNRRKDRRAQLVERLLAGSDFPRHFRDVFDIVLMERRKESVDGQRGNRQAALRDDRWYRFLEDAFRANRPWDEIVRELILARPADQKDAGALWFLYERQNNYQAIAEAVGPVAFGVQIKCAQCHNDPLAWEIEQRHYWGLVAAFNRSKNVETQEGIGVAESAVGGFINFQNLKKESQPALLAFLNGKCVPEKRPAEGEKETDGPGLYLVPPPKEKEKPAQAAIPKSSRREAVADALTRDNPMLARAFVNRIWALLLGRGLVHPVDQMTSRARPSHPDLLDWLAADFERSGFDVKRLIRHIVLSRVYQLDSAPRGRSAPPPEAFARALEKPLSAEQIYRSVLIATGNEAESNGQVAGHEEGDFRRAFIAKFPDLFPAEYNASLAQATFLSNSPLLDALLQKRPGNTTARLLQLDSFEARIGPAFATVLGRAPDSEERKRVQEFLAKQTTEAGVKHLLWALLASAEFQVNH
ncbi:MAG: DUF1553 domain-containing protein [Verrucomicrobia bacterium]|nr:DUF1553 domain-containing protein [Verrucomicrobiota bacterium]